MDTVIEIQVEDLDITNRLEKLPKLIRESELKALALNRRGEHLKARVEERKARILREISLEIDKDSKPKFRNEDSRNAEVIERFRMSKEYSDMENESLAYEYDYDKERITIKYLYNLFEAAKKLASYAEKS